MKSIKVLVVALTFAGISQANAALTCASPTVIGSGATISGVNSCTAANSLGTVCVFSNNPSPDVFFTFNLVTGYTATSIALTNSTGGFQPQMIVQTACGSTSDCTLTSPSVAAGANTSVSIAGQTATPSPGTQYFLAVNGASTVNAGDCGTFNISVTGTLPVQLEKFSID